MQTEKKHFEIFKSECSRLLKDWGLNNYHPRFEHKKLDDACARSCTSPQYNCTLALSTHIDWDEFVKTESLDEYLKKLAKHEVLHVLLGRLTNYANARYVNQDDLIEAEEELVRKLINIIK